MREKLKISIFSKMTFIGKLPEGVILTTQKIFCNLKSNWDHKLLIIESFLKFVVVLEL